MDDNTMLNWLRAAVLGAGDGIISVASIIVGVAGAIADVRTVLISGVAGLLAGAFSMAAGEYVSVSSQRDIERERLGKEGGELTSPVQAALASLVSFTIGGVIPLASLLLSSDAWRIPATFIAVLAALVITGILSARFSRAPYIKVTLRVVVGGLIAMATTYGIGRLFGVSGL